MPTRIRPAQFLERWRLTGLVLLVAHLAASATHAWGPHTEITRAALVVLSNRAEHRLYFKDDWERLARDYCWMGDWREAVRPDHYADDYLLFPVVPDHVGHMLPEVRRTYEPFFRRALQALRTECPHNAARWLGSLLHFVQDSGSPPHTTGIRGSLHGKMERWVDESKIDIGGYEPRLLGKTDDEALRGFLERLDGMIAFSKTRALQLKPLVEGLKERVNQPLELECALETARVSADLVHTLLTLGLASPPRPGCTLAGKLEYLPPAGYARVPAKVVLAGTSFSTTTSVDGTYHFRNLPPGKYDVGVLATGYETELLTGIELSTDRVQRLERRLRPDRVPGNLVRNPSFEFRWARSEVPDGWKRDPLHAGRWAGALIRVPLDRTCRVRVEFQPGESAAVAVRWRTDPSQANSGRTRLLDGTPLAGAAGVRGDIVADRLLQPFEKGVLFLEVLIETPRPLSAACRHVSVVFVEP